MSQIPPEQDHRQKELSATSLPNSPEASEACRASLGPGNRSTKWGCGMVKDKTLVPWDTVPLWMLWLGWGGSEYRFTCWGGEAWAEPSQGGDEATQRLHLYSQAHLTNMPCDINTTF